MFAPVALDANDLLAIHAIMHLYEGAGLPFADATLAHLAERKSICTAFTLDRRDI